MKLHRPTLARTATAFVFAVVLCRPLYAWGEKGHAITNEAATRAAPVALPSFFHRAYPQLVYLAYDPDRWKDEGETTAPSAFEEHFLDYEYTEGLTLTPNRYVFIHDLENSGVLRRYFITNDQVGFLPWNISELCERLTFKWRVWRREKDPVARQQVENDIIQLAGVLGHFVGDGANPHHTTIQFNGWIADNPQHYPNDCDTHRRFETMFVSTNMTTPMVYAALRPLKLRDEHYFNTAMELIRESNGLVEMMYRIDRDHGFTDSGTEEGRAFAVQRLAAGASLLRDLWFSCYVNSAKKWEAPAARPAQ